MVQPASLGFDSTVSLGNLVLYDHLSPRQQTVLLRQTDDSRIFKASKLPESDEPCQPKLSL